MSIITKNSITVTGSQEHLSRLLAEVENSESDLHLFTDELIDQDSELQIETSTVNGVSWVELAFTKFPSLNFHVLAEEENPDGVTEEVWVHNGVKFHLAYDYFGHPHFDLEDYFSYTPLGEWELDDFHYDGDFETDSVVPVTVHTDEATVSVGDWFRHFQITDISEQGDSKVVTYTARPEVPLLHRLVGKVATEYLPAVLNSEDVKARLGELVVDLTDENPQEAKIESTPDADARVGYVLVYLQGSHDPVADLSEFPFDDDHKVTVAVDGGELAFNLVRLS